MSKGQKHNADVHSKTLTLSEDAAVDVVGAMLAIEPTFTGLLLLLPL